MERFQERLREAIEVYDFAPLEDDVIQDVPLRVFRFSPKPGYQGHSRSTNILARMEGTVWIDRRDQLAKLQVRFVKNLKFLGGIFGGYPRAGGGGRGMVRWRRSLAAG